ncbi:MAG: helix-turn-helix domain-containing protein [Desulforhopalus sp.]
MEISKEILAALKTAGGNKAKAARILKIDRSTLYRKIRELHINTDTF